MKLLLSGLFPRLRLVCTLTAALMLADTALLPPLSAAWFTQLQLPVDNVLLRHVMNPDAAVLLLCAGWLLLCVEFCQPGRFLPGGLGVLAISLGGYSLGARMDSGLKSTVHWVGAVGTLVTVILTALLLWVAWLARRSKFRLDGKPIYEQAVYPDSLTSGPDGYTFGHSDDYSSTTKPAE